MFSKNKSVFFAFIFLFQLSIGNVHYSCKCCSLCIRGLETFFYKISFFFGSTGVCSKIFGFVFRFTSFVPLLIEN